MLHISKPEERLIVAADFKPTLSECRSEVRKKVLKLADSLHDTGVYLKLNSALRACGYELIEEIRARGLKVFADLKLYDISETLLIDGELLAEFKPELLTTVCSIGVKSLTTLKMVLPNTEVLGVTVLTSQTKEDIDLIYPGLSMDNIVENLAKLAMKAGLDGLISSPAEASKLRTIVGNTMTINTPAIRPTWAIVPGDDQNPDRIMTPAKAIKAGASRIVVGRPILLSENPRDAVKRTIEEIAKALE